MQWAIHQIMLATISVERSPERAVRAERPATLIIVNMPTVGACDNQLSIPAAFTTYSPPTKYRRLYFWLYINRGCTPVSSPK